MREWEFIEFVRSQGGLDAERVPLGPGDDAAVVRLGGELAVLTTDQVLDGVHVVLARHGPRAVGRKAMARSLSDIAAMAARPVAAVAAVALPGGFAQADAEEIYRGLREAGDALGCPLVGGDVGAWSGPLAVTVTIVGRPGPTPPVRRSGARVGDGLCVTGRLGAAWRTGRDLCFTPRVAEALALAEHFPLHAMIDISDGLSVDLAHLCRASGAGADVLAAAVPIHDDARSLDDPLAAALGDGEDYELLFALPAEQADRLCRDQPLAVPVSRIGTVVEGQRLTLVHPDGRQQELRLTGWEHRS